MTVHIEAVTFENVPEELLSIKFYISLCIASLSLLGDYFSKINPQAEPQHEKFLVQEWYFILT